LGELFAIADGVIGKVADCAAGEAVFVVWGDVGLEKFLDKCEGVGGGLCCGLPCLVVGDCGLSCGDLEGGFGAEADEAVLGEFLGAFD
jgi:hypothetical protein